jgi:hypothetical protein
MPTDHPKNQTGYLRQLAGDALRYWEPRRIAYNSILTAVVLGWVGLTWPHFRSALTLYSFLRVSVLALIANVCYCAAYLVDIPALDSSFTNQWRRWRPALWVAGTLFAILLTNYWIADEIYPFVN